jgi:peptidoglycan/xylan/chitin deacetylase (PgdA/CDA1 family)
MVSARMNTLAGKRNKLLAAVLLLWVILLLAACGPSGAAVVVAPARDVSPTAEQPTAGWTPAAVLEAPVSLTWTSTPTVIPSLTPLPTASPTTIATATVSATASATIDPSVTMVTEPLVASETATPTKPPPLPTPSGVYSWTLKVPILMYHYISEPPSGADKYRVDLSVAPDDFAAQMAYLTENGFETVDLYDLSLAITGKRELPEKPVIITLDDGYVDNYQNAFSILQEYGLDATFFVVTQFIDEGRDDYLTWDMIEEMAAAGMRIEPHSKTHPDLSEAERDYVIFEALGSQETIAAHIGYTPRYFCYPGGDYTGETMAILEELDFWGAVTTDSGDWHGFDDRFEWSRQRMRNTTSLREFANMVDPGQTVAGKPAE